MDMEQQQLWFWGMIRKVAKNSIMPSDFGKDFQVIDEDCRATPDELKEMYEDSIQPVVSTYFTGVVKAILDTNQTGSYSNPGLDAVLDARCGTKEFAEKVCLDVKEGKKILQTTKETFLEELAKSDLTLTVDEKTYTLHKTNDGLYVKIH